MGLSGFWVRSSPLSQVADGSGVSGSLAVLVAAAVEFEVAVAVSLVVELPPSAVPLVDAGSWVPVAVTSGASVEAAVGVAVSASVAVGAADSIEEARRKANWLAKHA